MGYTKVYDKLFIRVEDKKNSRTLYIPVCLYGSSNCTEYINGREVLERSWDLFSYCDEMFMADADQLMREVLARHKSGTCTENFQYKGRWLDDNAVVRFFESGIKNAVTIEEIREQLGDWESIHAYLYCWPKDGSSSQRLMQENLFTTEEIIQWAEEAKRKKAELLQSGDYASAYIGFGFYGRRPKRVIHHQDIGKPVIAKGRYGYVSEIKPDKRGWTCDRDPIKAIIFSNSEEAYASLPSSTPFTLVSADNIKQRSWVLSVDRCGKRLIIDRLTPRHCNLVTLPTSAHRRFSSQKEALAWFAEKIVPRFPSLTNPEAVQLGEV